MKAPRIIWLNIKDYLPIKIIQTSLMKKRFKNTFEFSNIGINKLIFLLRKGGCLSLYGWMGNVKWNIIATEEFYGNLNMEDITDTNYMHAKKICKNFEIKKLGQYHNLYLKIDILFLSDAFENLQGCV